MDVERALISKIVSTGQFEEVVAKGIDATMFADEDCREMFEYIARHTRRYKSCPSMEAAKEAHPDFEFEHIQDTLTYLTDRFSVLARKRLGQDLLFELGAKLNDPDETASIELHFLEAAREIATLVPSDSVARFSDMDKRIDEYEKEKEEGVPPGIPFGFPTLDLWTGGVQKHEFVTAAAFSGVGKSTLLRTIAFNVLSLPDDVVSLYISLEENSRAILRKLDAMATGIDYQKMKQLGLGDDDIEGWREKAEKWKEREETKNILILDRIRSCTPDKVFAETVRHKPDIVFIDYLSLMRSSHPSRQSSMWQSLTEITQDLKQNARVLEVPIIAAAQTNRSGAKDGADLDNIGYALSVVQDSDIVLGLFADEEMKENKRMEVRVKKNREGRLGKFSCIWNHEESDFREETMTDRFGGPGRDRAPRLVDTSKPAFKASTATKRPRPSRNAPKARPRPQRRAA